MSPELLRGPTPMLVGVVIAFALLAVGFGYVAFGVNRGPGVLYHAGFLVFTLAFLVAFVRLLWIKGGQHVHSNRNPWEAGDSGGDE